jgi:hypothetical protein
MSKIKLIIAASAAVTVITAVLLFALRVPVKPLQIGYLYYNEPADNTAQYFEQPLIYGMEFQQLNAADNPSLSSYGLIVVDSSVESFDRVRKYAENGGTAVISSKQLLLTDDLSFDSYTPAQGADASLDNPIAQIFADYFHYFERFSDYETLKDAPAGYTLRPAPGVTPLVLTADGSGALAARLDHGKGHIYYFGALLPDAFFTTSFDMQPREGQLPYFNNTAAAASHLLWNELASEVSKEVRGFSLKRVFGLHGRPSMAHQNHFEVLSMIGRGSLESFAEMARAHDQIASYSLTEGVYEWFERYESFGYALSYGDGTFENDPTDDYYAWGSHIVMNDRWLNLAKSDTAVSYFINPEEPTRSYPAVLDFNGDGVPDLISGSSDGYFHVFGGVSLSPRWTVEPLGKLRGLDGTPLSVGAFSAPAISGNFFISGSESGHIYVWNWTHSLTLDPEPVMVIPPPPGETLSAPDIVGSYDIIAGYASGAIYYYDRAAGYTPRLLMDSGWKNAAPRMDSGGNLIIGTHNGDILQYTYQNGAYHPAGPLKVCGSPVNFKGTTGFNSGSNVTPVFYDLNGDGHPDLIWGLLEYGNFSVSITDELFPYRAELTAALETLEAMHVPVILHNYTHRHKSINDERVVLAAELAAFSDYGLGRPAGVNQHTWFTSPHTLRLQLENGFHWNSGFRPYNSPANPADFAEYGMITPFYLHGDGRQMLLCNANLRGGFLTPARYDLPVTLFRHTEYAAIENPGSVENYLKSIGETQQSLLYNFVTEPQLFKSIAAVMAADVRVTRRPADMLADLFRRAAGRTPRLDLRLSVQHKDTTAPLYDKRYADSIGVRVELGGKARPYLDSDALVRHQNNLSLAGGPVRIWTRHEQVTPPVRLAAVNLPAKISQKRGEIKIEFLEDGLQQAFIYAGGEIIKHSYTGSRRTFTLHSTNGQEIARPLG